MVSMRPAALHDEQRIVLLVWFWNVLDCGFPVLSAFHESPELLSAEHYPQAGFPAASYKGYPAQTVSLCGISLLVEHKCDGLAPVALVSVCSVAVAVLVGCVYPPCASVAFFRLTVYRIQTDARTMAPEQVLLRYLLPLAEQKHAAPAPVVPGLACAAALLARSVSVYRLGANGAFPVPVAVHFPVVARLGAEIFVALLA